MTAWNVSEGASATGNPLINDPDLDQLRRAHRIHNARYGAVSLKVRPVTVAILCNHAEMFWYGTIKEQDVRDVQFHSILVLGLNMGKRFDEVSKLSMELVSTTSDKATSTLVESTKKLNCST